MYQFYRISFGRNWINEGNCFSENFGIYLSLFNFSINGIFFKKTSMKIGSLSFKSLREMEHKAIFIGKGSFGSVYCVSDETGKKYALKIMTQESMENPDKYSCYISEAHILTKVSYPTILHLYEYYEYSENESSNILMILTEYCENKSLNNFFSKRNIIN